jgi:hypothetical protein
MVHKSLLGHARKTFVYSEINVGVPPWFFAVPTDRPPASDRFLDMGELSSCLAVSA